MTRNFNLMRSLLLQIEAHKEPALTFVDPHPDVQHQLTLMAQAELVHIVDASSLRSRKWDVSIKWRGHELLDVIRPDAVWAKVQAMGPVPFDLIQELAQVEFAKHVKERVATG